MALTYSFYAEVAAARGDIDEARRRRLERARRSTWRCPTTRSSLAARAYSRGKLGVLDGDLVAAERCYREAADGFSRIDRPMMRSMCLGIVADFDERAGDHRAAIARLEEAVEINDALGLRGFIGALLARLGWALLQDGDVGRAELVYERALDLARRLSNTTGDLPGPRRPRRASTGSTGATDEAAAAAIEALELHLAGGPRRLANRIDPRADVLAAAAVCCVVLGVLSPPAAGHGEHAAELLGHADRLLVDAGAVVPPFQRDDVERARRTAVARCRRRRLRRGVPSAVDTVASDTIWPSPSDRGGHVSSRAVEVSGERSPTSAASWMVASSRTRRADIQEDPVSALLFRLGRSSARHPFRVIGLWLVAAVAVVGLQGARRR